MYVDIEENKNNLVVKHQDLVRTARYKLSELGIKVVSVLISMIRVSDEDFKEYQLKINDFKELIGTDSKKTYEYVDVMTDELMKKPFKIGDEKFNWVYYAKYHHGDNYVTLKISPELKPYLLGLQRNFLKYNVINILQLKSSYIIRFYELCKDHFMVATRKKEHQKSVKFELQIDKMRELFEIPSSYQYSSHIKKRILEKSKEQFKQKTDIQIEYEEQKIGRRIDRIIVTVRANNKGSGDYLSSRHKFIAYVRKHYAPDGWNNKYPPILVTDKGTLKIDNDGRLYISQNPNTLPGVMDLDHNQANATWTWLYESVKSGEVELIPPPGAEEEGKAEAPSEPEPPATEKKNEERVNKMADNLVKRF